MAARRAVYGLLVLAFPAISAGKLPEGEGKKIVETTCGSCHGLDVVTSKRYSRERWQAVVSEMVAQGAALDKSEAARVVDYLAAHFGEKQAKQLYEEICSYCHELDRVMRQQLTKDGWRGLIRGMVDEGAPVTEEEFSMIVDYLAEHFGPQPTGEQSQ
jgi:mono/diheme cytochrome c family protein